MQATHRPTLALFALAAALALPACRQQPEAEAAASVASAPATATSAQAMPAPIDDAAIDRYLATIYGTGASVSREWNTAPHDAALKAKQGESDGAVTRKLCARKEIVHAGQPALLLAICGKPKDFGHPTPGLTDLFLLRADAGQLAPVARADFEEFGSMGDTGTVEPARFGADLYGFVVNSGFFNMGQGVETRTVLLHKGDSFQEAGWFRASLDNTQAQTGCKERGDCKPDTAYDIDFAMKIDDSQPDAAAYPLLITESGTACGEPADAQHRLTLDPATLRYAVPAALQRETCAVEAD